MKSLNLIHCHPVGNITNVDVHSEKVLLLGNIKLNKIFEYQVKKVNIFSCRIYGQFLIRRCYITGCPCK